MGGRRAMVSDPPLKLCGIIYVSRGIVEYRRNRQLLPQSLDINLRRELLERAVTHGMRAMDPVLQ